MRTENRQPSLGLNEKEGEVSLPTVPLGRQFYFPPKTAIIEMRRDSKASPHLWLGFYVLESYFTLQQL